VESTVPFHNPPYGSYTNTTPTVLEDLMNTFVFASVPSPPDHPSRFRPYHRGRYVQSHCALFDVCSGCNAARGCSIVLGAMLSVSVSVLRTWSRALLGAPASPVNARRHCLNLPPNLTGGSECYAVLVSVYLFTVRLGGGAVQLMRSLSSIISGKPSGQVKCLCYRDFIIKFNASWKIAAGPRVRRFHIWVSPRLRVFTPCFRGFGSDPSVS
jgi:hypothetical protein